MFIFRRFIEEICRVVTPHNFVLFCAILCSQPYYEPFVDSLKRHLAILINIYLINARSFKLDILLDVLQQEKVLSTEDIDKIKSFKVARTKQNFIKIMQAKVVSDYSKLEKFMDCLKSEKSFREFEHNTHTINTVNSIML